MKTVLALALLLFTTTAPAFADHIGIYRDAEGMSCTLDAGYSNTTAIIHKFSLGSIGCQFRVDFSQAPGSTFIAFHTSYMPVGELTTGIAVGYGLCLTNSIVVGTFEATLSPGMLYVLPPTGYTNILNSDCHMTDYPATGGNASVGSVNTCNQVEATEPSTWGHVKALYR